MNVNGELSLDEAKRVAVLGGEAAISAVVPALRTLYDEIRRLEIERDAREIRNGPR